MTNIKRRFRVKGPHALALAFTAVLVYLLMGSRLVIGHEAKEQPSYRLGVVQFSESPDFEEARKGLVEEVQQGLSKDQAGANIEWASAGGELLGIMSILRDFRKKRPDVLVTLSSPCLEEASQIIEEIPTVFGACFNPKFIGFDESRHVYMRNFTGIYGEPPLEELVRIIQLVTPRVKTVAVLWNPSEINSRYEMGILRAVCRRHNLHIMEERLRRSGQIRAKAQALLEFDPDVFVLFADNTIREGFPSIAALLKAKGVPVFTDMPDLAEKGALLELGFDYYSWGQETGKMVLEILAGKAPREVPVRKFEHLRLAVNLKTARQLNLSIPKEVLDRANKLID
jgi:putative ABC transport system substrate-binding protein